MFFAVSRCRTGGKVERGDRTNSARRVHRQRAGGRGGRLAHDGASLKSEYRVDGKRLGRPGRRRTQHVGLGAVPAGRPHATRVTLENSCGCGRGRCCCCCGGRPVPGCTVQLLSVIGVMMVMVMLLLVVLLVLVLLVMVTVLLLVQFEQLRQSSVVLLEQRILQHHHSR